MEENRLTITQAAQEASCDRSTVWTAIKRGYLKAEQITVVPGSRGVWFINRDSFNVWMTTRRGVREGQRTINNE